jgi:hypothetical protein
MGISGALDSKTSSIFKSFTASVPDHYLLLGGYWKTGSIAILNTESNIDGIILASRGQQTSKLGFVLTSINFIFISSSIMKSYPKISKVLVLLDGSIFFSAALKVSLTSALI